MTANKPEVKRYKLSSGYDSMMRRVNRMQESEGGVYVRFDDYEALQVEIMELKRALAESLANDRQAMYYLNQVREIVGGNDFPDMVRRCEKLRAEREKLRAAMIDAKGYIDHYMYGGSIYREPAAEAIALIDDALQEGPPCEQS